MGSKAGHQILATTNNMSPTQYDRLSCRLCESKQLTKVFQLTPTPPANAFISKNQLSTKQKTFPLDLFFCEGCAHLQLLVVLDPKELFENYVYVSGTSSSFVKHFSDYAESCINKFNLSTDDIVIDIGSNDGTLLQFFKNAKMKILGIDPARTIAKKATKNGIETWPEFFSEAVAARILNEKGQVPLITANNLFAHVDDLSGIVKNIRALLNRVGVFVFEVSYLGAVYEDTLFDTIYHEHVSYHSISPLIDFFNSMDMELFAVERVLSHGGSIRVMVQLNGGPYKIDDSVQSLIDYEYKLGLNRPEIWVGYAQKINTLRNKLTKILIII